MLNVCPKNKLYLNIIYENRHFLLAFNFLILNELEEKNLSKKSFRYANVNLVVVD